MTYADTRARVEDMLGDKGQSLTLTRRSAGSYSTATGSATITTSTQTVKGAILPLSAFHKSQGNIVEGDQQLLLAAEDTSGSALSPIPHVDDTATDANGDVWTITAVEPLSPAGTTVLFDCVIRRAA